MNAEPSLPPPRHEATDAAPRVVAIIAGALAVLIAIGLVAGLGSFAGGTAPRELAPAADQRFQNGPRDRPATEATWDAYERDVQLHLGGYGWVDRKAGRVRVPLSRAIDLVSAEAARESQSSQIEGKP